MKKHMPKNKFFVSYISNFLLQYEKKKNCSTYGNKLKKQKKNVQLMVKNKIQNKKEKRHKLLLMSNMVLIRILLTKYNRDIIQIIDITFWWKRNGDPTQYIALI